MANVKSQQSIAIVTGAHGFVGRHVARELCQNGYSVYGIGHGQWSQENWKQWGLTSWQSADVTAINLQTFAIQPSLLVHCAGGASVATSVKDPELDLARTVDSTREALQYFSERSPDGIFVLPSSAAVYGLTPNAPIDEASPLRPASPYGQHKVMAEGLCREFAKKAGVRNAVVRLFSVYGQGLEKQLLFDACRKIQNNTNSFFGSGQETRDWLHVTDASALLRVCAESLQSRPAGESLVINGGTGVATKLNDVLGHIFRHFHLTDEPYFNGEVRTGDPSYYWADVTKTKSQLGFEPKMDWMTGVADYCEWYRQQFWKTEL